MTRLDSAVCEISKFKSQPQRCATKMQRVRKESLIVGRLQLLTSPAAPGQTTTTALLPEVDSYLRFNPNVRLFFEAKGQACAHHRITAKMLVLPRLCDRGMSVEMQRRRERIVGSLYHGLRYWRF